MSDDSHHTPGQARTAFARAHDILVDLRAHGVEAPRFELFVDGSGRLVLGPRGKVTLVQYQRAVELVLSERMDFDADEIAIRFCCGLVEHEAEPEPPVYTEAELAFVRDGIPEEAQAEQLYCPLHGEPSDACTACCTLRRRPEPEPCATCRGKEFTCSCGDPDHVPCQSSHRVVPCSECSSITSKSDPRDRAAWLDGNPRGY